MRKLHVNLGENSYDILFERGIVARAGEFVRSDGGKVAIVTDENVASHYLRKVSDSLASNGYNVCSLVLPAGESTKSFDTLKTVYSFLCENKITRKDCIVTLGGGVIGDLGGFAAATYLRGVDFYQIPTSLLAQVDSSIGGKVAVDLPEGKNLAGAFYQPKVVLIDVDALSTLNDSFFVDGMAEVIKYGCIKDRKLFDLLVKAGGKDGFMRVADDVIMRCCDIKREVVEKDEKDKGDRMLLNFGHTYGHALEKYYNFCGLTHGRAVAVGMCEICRIAEQKGLTTGGTKESVARLCEMYGLPTSDSAKTKDVVGAIGNDKKNLGDKLVVVLLEEIGKSYLYKTTAEFFN